MAAKKPAKKTNTVTSTEISTKVVPTLAQVLEPQAPARYDMIDLPEFAKGEKFFEKEAPLGFTPLIQFGESAAQWKEGSWIIARYLATREEIGPNKSNMYDFEVTPDGKTFSPASLWGSTIFDDKFRLLNPHPGQWIFIQYLGTTPTSRRMNEAKDYRLAIVAEDRIAQLGYGAKG